MAIPRRKNRWASVRATDTFSAGMRTLTSGANQLDGGGIREATLLRAVTKSELALRCEITVWTTRTDDGKAAPRPSLLLANPPELALLRAWDPAHERGLFEYDGSVVRAQARFPPGTSFYGAGLVASRLLRNGRSILLWNSDSFGYGEETPALYQSHPYVLALLPDGRAAGLLADSCRRGSITIASDAVEFAFEEEPFDLYRIEADHPLEVTQGLAALVGTMALPPLWSLGYHQCRWSYATAEEALAIARELRRRGIPCDGIWLDIDYMDRFRLFTWNDASFPLPKALTDELHASGFRCVAIVDPGIAAQEDFDLCRRGLAGGHFVLDELGRAVKGRVWPGPCYFPDFTSARTRAWWSEQVERFAREAGLDGIWNDMNEPALLRAPTKTLSERTRHAGLDGLGGSHSRYHNLYGQLMAQASRSGVERAFPERRPFLLTRANHVSGARFAAAWTGDNQSRWQDLRLSIPMVLSLGLCGQPFAGPDVGGFSGDPTPELFARWFELGALLPFFRGHSDKTSCRKEPWSFGPEVEALVRAAIERRMRLLPTLYALFHEAASLGLPVVRPLFFADPQDPALRAIDDQFLLGDALLVAPIVEKGKTSRTVVLPRGGWYAFPDGAKRVTARRRKVRAPLGILPMFARAGSMLFECAPRERASAGFGDTLTVHVFLDRRGRASGRVYEDEGEGYGYRDGGFRVTSFEARKSPGGIEIDERGEGGWSGGTRRRVFLVRDGKETSRIDGSRC